MSALGSLGGSCFAGGSSISGPTLAGNSLAGDTLGARVYTLESLGGDGDDPVVAYGQRASAWIMSAIERVPLGHRKAALRALLDTVDPTLWAAVDAKGLGYTNQGLSAKAALARALAECMAAGIAKEVVDVGGRVLRGDPSPVKALGALGLGCYPAAAQTRAMEALGWNPVAAIADAAKAVARGVSHGAGAVWDGTKWVGGEIGDGASAAAGFVKTGATKLGGLACDLANSSVGSVVKGVGTAAATVYAGPAGAAGAAAGSKAISGLCAKKQADAAAGLVTTPTAPPKATTPSWLVPAAIGGGGLLLYLALKKR